MNKLHPSGFIYFLRGFSMLTNKGIRHYVIIPTLLNFILFSIFIGVGVHFINHFTDMLPHWLTWLKWIFDILFFAVSSIILMYLFMIITNLIGAPFNSFLSEKVEMMITGKKPNENDGFKDTIKDIPRIFKREIQKILYYLPRAVLLLILYFIPVINIAAGILWFLFTAWVMAMQYIDYPMDNHRTTFKEMKQFLHSHCIPSLSFGLGVTIAAMIPIINFFVMPAAVIGATLMYIDRESDG